MINEYHAQGNISWPDGRRIAVFLTFDFQGGEPERPLPNGRMNYENWTQGEYGPKTGIWRILRILREKEVKATFLTCGGIAERYAEPVKAIVAEGHEIAGHGYHHEVARDLSEEEERDVIRRATEMIRIRTGRRAVGWRSCTQSPNTLKLLMEQDYLWNSNSFAHDLPHVFEEGGRILVELPRQPYGDGWIYGSMNSTGNPAVALIAWKALFDELYRESALAPTYCPFTLHPYISSRPGRANVLAEMIQYMKEHTGVWFATGSEIAHWWLEQDFSKISAPARPRAVAQAGT